MDPGARNWPSSGRRSSVIGCRLTKKFKDATQFQSKGLKSDDGKTERNGTTSGFAHHIPPAIPPRLLLGLCVVRSFWMIETVREMSGMVILHSAYL